MQRVDVTDVHDANQIANFALVEWSDNIDISEKTPVGYVKGFLNCYNEDEWKTQRFLPALPEGWEQMSYSEFLIKRRKMIADVIMEGYKKLA